MKLEISFESGFEKFMALTALMAVLAAAFLVGYLFSPGAAYAEWDSSSSFGDSYYLRQMAGSMDDISGRLSDISRTLSNIERSMP